MIAKLLIVAISTIIFFRNINAFPLRNWDEAWYGEIIKNMATGNYSLLIPYWNGQYYFDKPPLYFWLSLPLFEYFGPGEWQARVISAAASVLASFLTYLIAKKLFGQTAAIFALLIFITLGQVVVRFAHGNLDALMISLFLLSFYFFLASEQKPAFAILAGIALGLGTLVKGALIGLFPFLTVILYSLCVYKKITRSFITIAAFALISSGIYYLAAAAKFGQPFIQSYILKPDAGLLRSPLESFSPTYIRDFLRDVGFWWLIVLPTLVIYLKNSQLTKKTAIYLAFTISIFAFILPLNFLSEKLGWYNLPVYPFTAIIIGSLTSQFFKKNKIIIPIFLTLLISTAQIYNVVRIENIYPDRSQVGAQLGLIAQDTIPDDAKIILDDKDFTTFLFYSDHGQIFVSLPQGGKDWEWWIISYNQLDQFISQNSPTWVITQNANLPITNQGEVKKEAYGYQFIRY